MYVRQQEHCIGVFHFQYLGLSIKSEAQNTCTSAFKSVNHQT